MKQSNYLLFSILLLFLMLWLPMGQYDYLLDNWMKIGTYAVPFLLMGAFSFYDTEQSPKWWANYRFQAILFLIAYIIHQYEEHWIDLFGNYYAFYTYNNNFITSALGEPESSVRPLTKAAVFVINTSLVWLVGCLGIWRSPQHIFPLIAMASIVVVNGVVHLLAGIATWGYNPGLLTSVLLFIPAYLLFARNLINTPYRKQIWAGLIWAFVAHILMVGGLIAANWYQLFPEWLYFLILVIWSILPITLFRK